MVLREEVGKATGQQGSGSGKAVASMIVLSRVCPFEIFCFCLLFSEGNSGGGRLPPARG